MFQNGTWIPYVGIEAVWLAGVLLAVAGGLLLLGADCIVPSASPAPEKQSEAC